MNILKINGTAISGIYVDAAVSFNKPAKRVQSISVPGRNGNLIIDEGAFDNVLISYPVFEKSSFPMEFDSIVNWLASLEGYQRIECSNDPTHFRLGRFVVPQTPTSKRLNRDGYYQLSFDCKPQRYLNLGEVPTEIDANPSETYGPADIVSFEAAQEDTISGAEFSIVPQQDLHGYDSPWPAGGGKNLFDADALYSAYKQSDGSFIGRGADITGIQFNIPQALVGQELTFSAYAKVPSDSTITNIRVAVNVGGSNINGNLINEASYTLTKVTFTPTSTSDYVRVTFGSNGAQNMQFKDVQLELGSSATSFAPYANICPISGFTGAEITRGGKNLVFAEDRSGITTQTYVTEVFSLPTGTYTMSADLADANQVGVALRLIKNGTASTRTPYSTTTSPSRESGTFTVNDTDTLRLVVVGAAAGYNGSVSKVQVELGSTATTYEPYVGTTHSITWQDDAGTVYGGTLQYMGGDAWRLTKTMQSGDMGDLTWTYDTTTLSVPVFYSSNFNPSKKLGSDNMVSPCYKTVSTRSYLVDNDFALAPWNSTNSGHIGVRDSRYTDAATFTTAVTGQQLVYELATPVVYDLTGDELARIVGQNNIFANCGQSTVVITEPTYFVNPGYFTSKPIIRVYGDGTFRVGDNIITIEEHDESYIDINSELQDCYCGDTNMNEYVTFTSGNYPELAPGSTYVLMGEGITKLIITPNWWEL